MNKKAGILKNCVNDRMLTLIATSLKNKATKVELPHSTIYTTTRDATIFQILESQILKEIGKYFDTRMKISVLSYTESTDSYGIHFDDYQSWQFGKPYVSILLPITTHALLKTFIFDCALERTETNNTVNINALEYIKDFNIGDSCFCPGMEHLDPISLTKIKLLDGLEWEKNGAVWWESNLLHASCKHQSENWPTKQFIIMHTAIPN